MREYGLFEVMDSLYYQLKPTRLTSSFTSTSTYTSCAAPSTSVSLSGNNHDTLHEVCVQLMHSINVGSVPNYGVCDELRRMVQVCLKSCSRAVRLGAILQVKRAVRKDLSTSWQ